MARLQGYPKFLGQNTPPMLNQNALNLRMSIGITGSIQLSLYSLSAFQC